MFDACDVAQEVEIAKLNGVAVVSKRIVKLRLDRKHRRPRSKYGVVGVTREELASVPDSRSDARDALVDLEGLPVRDYEVARLLANGARWGEIEEALGITR